MVGNWNRIVVSVLQLIHCYPMLMYISVGVSELWFCTDRIISGVDKEWWPTVVDYRRRGCSVMIMMT